MTMNNLLEAVAAKLTGIWPDRNVYVDEIPQQADGQFFVGMAGSKQERLLDRRRKRTISLEVLYFLTSKDNMGFNHWAETMYNNFETLSVREDSGHVSRLRLTNQQTVRGSDTRAFQFLFDAQFFFVLPPKADALEENAALMGDLQLWQSQLKP